MALEVGTSLEANFSFAVANLKTDLSRETFHSLHFGKAEKKINLLREHKWDKYSQNIQGISWASAKLKQKKDRQPLFPRGRIPPGFAP